MFARGPALHRPYFLRGYDPDSEGLFSFSAVGRKVAWMRENPRVCVEVEDVGDRFHWTTVVVFGHYQEIERSPAHSGIRKRALDLFEQRTQWWLPGAANRRGKTTKWSSIVSIS